MQGKWVVQVYRLGSERRPSSVGNFDELQTALYCLKALKMQDAHTINVQGPSNATDAQRQAIRDAGGRPTRW